MNALGQPGDGDVFRGLCDDINADRSIRAVVLTGQGRAFSAGGYVIAMLEPTGAFDRSPAEIRCRTSRDRTAHGCRRPGGLPVGPGFRVGANRSIKSS